MEGVIMKKEAIEKYEKVKQLQNMKGSDKHMLLERRLNITINWNKNLNKRNEKRYSRNNERKSCLN